MNTNYKNIFIIKEFAAGLNVSLCFLGLLLAALYSTPSYSAICLSTVAGYENPYIFKTELDTDLSSCNEGIVLSQSESTSYELDSHIQSCLVTIQIPNTSSFALQKSNETNGQCSEYVNLKGSAFNQYLVSIGLTSNHTRYRLTGQDYQTVDGNKYLGYETPSSNRGFVATKEYFLDIANIPDPNSGQGGITEQQFQTLTNLLIVIALSFSFFQGVKFGGIR